MAASPKEEVLGGAGDALPSAEDEVDALDPTHSLSLCQATLSQEEP